MLALISDFECWKIYIMYADILVLKLEFPPKIACEYYEQRSRDRLKLLHLQGVKYE